jgi:biotin carboxyl carrier protein
MRVEVVVNGRPISVHLQAGAAAVEVEPGIWSVLLDGVSYEVKLEPADDGYWATVGRCRYRIQVRDPRRLPRARTALSASGRQRVTSPMPGKVVRVLVREGDEVQPGGGLVVVEAMKMQNEIRSPKAGRVISLRAAEGQAVAAGETLAEVE